MAKHWPHAARCERYTGDVRVLRTPRATVPREIAWFGRPRAANWQATSLFARFHATSATSVVAVVNCTVATPIEGYIQTRGTRFQYLSPRPALRLALGQRSSSKIAAIAMFLLSEIKVQRPSAGHAAAG